jgi:RimJ/RimL family protein N-acetyltransferase
VRLRAATAADLAWVERLATGEDVKPFLAPGAAVALPDALARGELLVAEDDAGAPVGAVRAVVTNHRSRIAAIRTLMIDPAARGRGLGVAVIRAVVDDLVTGRGMHRVEAEAYGFNAAALRAFAAAGFTREGTRRRAYDRHGAWQDGVAFGLLADDREP